MFNGPVLTEEPTLAPDVAARLRRNDAGLVPAVVQDATTGDVLMMAWMDDVALARTLTTRRATYWSRGRPPTTPSTFVRFNSTVTATPCYFASTRSEGHATPVTTPVSTPMCSWTRWPSDDRRHPIT